DPSVEKGGDALLHKQSNPVITNTKPGLQTNFTGFHRIKSHHATTTRERRITNLEFTDHHYNRLSATGTRTCRTPPPGRPTSRRTQSDMGRRNRRQREHGQEELEGYPYSINVLTCSMLYIPSTTTVWRVVVGRKFIIL